MKSISSHFHFFFVLTRFWRSGDCTSAFKFCQYRSSEFFPRNRQMKTIQISNSYSWSNISNFISILHENFSRIIHIIVMPWIAWYYLINLRSDWQDIAYIIYNEPHHDLCTNEFQKNQFIKTSFIAHKIQTIQMIETHGTPTRKLFHSYAKLKSLTVDDIGQTQMTFNALLLCNGQSETFKKMPSRARPLPCINIVQLAMGMIEGNIDESIMS